MRTRWSPSRIPRREARSQADRLGKVPPLAITAKRTTATLEMAGLDPGNPVVCGTVTDGMGVVQIRATGLACNVRAGQTRWVIGTGVDQAIADGSFVVVADRAPVPVVRPTRLPDGAPGADPTNLATIDQWRNAFTPCTRCTGPAGPGTELCASCTAAEADDPTETPLARALRLAGT